MTTRQSVYFGKENNDIIVFKGVKVKKLPEDTS